MRNPYQVLGLPVGSDEDKIRKAYRALAKKYHPDVNQGNKSSETMFKEISAAYDFLSDATKKARFDKGEIDADGRETYAQHGFGGGGFGGGDFGGADINPEDILSQIFRRRPSAPVAGRNFEFMIEIDFIKGMLGCKYPLRLPNGKSLEVAIPAGVADGQILRMKQQGEPSPMRGGIAGDLLLTLKIRPHPYFKRDGDHIKIDLPLSLEEAILGSKIDVPTLTGIVTMNIPSGTNTDTVMRLKGKGIKGGDQYVTLKVMLPAKVDKDLAALIKKWGEEHHYNPRHFF
jgi:DnaJ-class molecular chaperone